MGVVSRQLVLVALVLVCGNFAQANEVSREDAELDPPMEVVSPSGVESSLFKGCIAAANTFTATFFTMETPNGAEYQRYIPDESMRLNLVWDTVTQPIRDIFDCAEACESTNDCYMFKYDGTHCKVTLNNAYDLSIEPMCEIGIDTEAVFVLTTASASLPCLFPTFSVKNDGSMCVGVAIGDVVSLADADYLCKVFGSDAYNYDELYDLSIADTEARLKALGYTQDLRIDARWDGSAWVLDEFSDPIDISAQMGGGLPSWGSESDAPSKLFMKATDDFKLHAAAADETLPGALCLIPV